MREDRLAQIIGNVLGAAEMLNGPSVDAMRVIERVLHTPELYAEFLIDLDSATPKTVPCIWPCSCTCLHTIHPVEHHVPGCPQHGNIRPHGI